MIDKSKFSNKKDLVSYLVANKSDIITLKKSVIKFADPIIFSSPVKKEATKVIIDKSKDNLEEGVIKRTIVGNTYGWMDSHDDVHMSGVFTKSISENKSNIFHLHDHLYQVTAKVGTPINIYEQSIKLSDLGLNMAGYTTALLMDSDIKESYNEMIFEEYLNNQVKQHSVGMIYVKLFLCVNDEDFKEEYANWNTYKNQVINIDKAEKEGYFWAITEAKLREISCVLQGSNELTPTLEPNKITQTIEPIKITRIDYDYLIKNFK